MIGSDEKIVCDRCGGEIGSAMCLFTEDNEFCVPCAGRMLERAWNQRDIAYNAILAEIEHQEFTLKFATPPHRAYHENKLAEFRRVIEEVKQCP